MKRVEELHPHTDKLPEKTQRQEPAIEYHKNRKLHLHQFGAMQFQVEKSSPARKWKVEKASLLQVKIGSQVKQIVSY